jgi:nucleoside-diphosphate-sugar epimerase
MGMDEEWPARPAQRLFYAQEKAELEQLLHEQAGSRPDLKLYMLRPPIVLGPHAVGAKTALPSPVAGAGRAAQRLLERLPVRVPMLAPDLPLQFIHEDDVGQALLLCVVGAGPPGVYNIAADGVLSVTDVVRELGLAPIPVPGSVVRAGARALARLPQPTPALEWVEAASQPSIMDTGKARKELGWKPRYSALEALRSTLDG